MKCMLYKISYAIIIIAMCVLLYIAYLTFYPLNIIDLHSISATPLQSKPGKEIVINMSFTKHMDYKPEIVYSLDCVTRTYQLMSGSIKRPVGENKTTIYKLIPTGVPPKSTCKVHVDLSYDVTAFRTINYSWVTNEIRIIR